MSSRAERDTLELIEVDAMVRHFTGLNPEALTDDEYIDAFRDYSLVRKRELADFETAQLNALLRFWNLINKK